MDAGFFAPNVTYLLDAPYRAPEVLPQFQCVAVAVHPSKGEDRAFGFYRAGSMSAWVSHAMNADEWERGWVARPDSKPPLLDYDDGLADFPATTA